MKHGKMSKEQRLRLIKQVAERAKRKKENKILFSLQTNPEMFESLSSDVYIDLHLSEEILNPLLV